MEGGQESFHSQQFNSMNKTTDTYTIARKLIFYSGLLFLAIVVVKLLRLV